MMGPNGRSRLASASHTVVLVGGFDRAAGEGVEAKERCPGWKDSQRWPRRG